MNKDFSLEKRQWVRLTKVCNNNCIFCLDKEMQDGNFIPYEIIKNELAKGIKENATRAVLSGGEPTLHPQLLDIISMAKGLGYREVQIITNGRMFAYKKFLEKAIRCGLGEVTFSIHAHTKELHDLQTQVQGSFLQSIKGLINAISSRKLIVNVDIVINNTNYQYLPEIIIFFNNLGVDEFDLLQLTPFGNAWKNKEEVFYNLNDISPYLEKTIKIATERNIRLWTNRFPPEYLEGYEYLIQDPIKIYDEVKGREEIFNDYIFNNKIMTCYNRERCNLCWMNKFCNELISLKEKMKKEGVKAMVNKKVIDNPPACLEKKASLKKIYNLGLFDKYLNIKINKFTKYFIKYRYKVKSLRCKECKLYNNCEGIHINYIKNFGFKMVKPIT